MFFINIHCGLALITYEKQLLNVTFAGSTLLLFMVSVIPSITATFNAFGRIGYSTISDKLKDRNTIYKIIFASSIIITLISLLTSSISNGYKGLIYGIITILLLVIINAGYGGGFSTLPALLSSRFGMKNISKIHGLALSAWAIAGLTGNNMSELVLNITNNRYDDILIFTCIFYVIAFIISSTMIKDKKRS
jgi:OFA family oxalate/formate antiporter-like MFS transporter